jgi:hypothetical protein
MDRTNRLAIASERIFFNWLIFQFQVPRIKKSAERFELRDQREA